MTSKNNKVIVKEITKTQADFLEFLEEFGHGKLELDVKFGQPVGVWPVVKGGVVQHYTKFD